jgi:hypothetical protein
MQAPASQGGSRIPVIEGEYNSGSDWHAKDVVPKSPHVVKSDSGHSLSGEINGALHVTTTSSN